MGLKNKLNQTGSPLSKNNGGQNVTPIGATKESQLHGFGKEAGYSVDGTPSVPFKGHFTNYVNKPNPSELDMSGITPTSALNAPGKPHLGKGYAKGTYKNSAPIEGLGNI